MVCLRNDLKARREGESKADSDFRSAFLTKDRFAFGVSPKVYICFIEIFTC